jgi:predicted AlkP superfamily pyrophosphatase or phosphodiesterase
MTPRLQIIILLWIICTLTYFVDFHNEVANYYQIHQAPDEVVSAVSNVINEADKFDKWIVITTINYPTEQVRRYSQMSDWRLIVVADRKTHIDWQNKNNPVNCVFLSLEMQQTLNYKLIKLIPENSYTRKAIGYLYAIEHGAKWIYDTDDDNGPYGNWLR